MVTDAAEVEDKTRPRWSAEHPFTIEEAGPDDFTLDVVYRYEEKLGNREDLMNFEMIWKIK